MGPSEEGLTPSFPARTAVRLTMLLCPGWQVDAWHD